MQKKVNKVVTPAALLFILLITGLLILTFLYEPTITGFVSAEVVSSPLNLTLTESKQFFLVPSKDLTITSLLLSGSADGPAEVYFEAPDGGRQLIFSNRRSDLRQNLITGFATPAAPQIVLSPGESSSPLEPFAYDTIQFSRACVETCATTLQLSSNTTYTLLAQLAAGTTLALTELTYQIG